MSRLVAHIGKLLAFSLAPVALSTGCGTQLGIAASPSVIYLEVGDSAAVNVVAVMDVGSPATLTSPSTITSSNEAIASVSGEVVLGIAEGTATLTITDGVFTTTATVNVVATGTLPTVLVVTPTSITCTPESEDAQLEVFAVLRSGASENVTDRATFTSSDTDIALVTVEGFVVCVSEGEAAINAEYLGLSRVLQVAVGPVPPIAVNVSPSTLTCEVGEQSPVQVLASWEDGSTTDVTLSASYSSNDISIATAFEGQVQCLSEGSATILADVSGVAAVLNVDVQTVVVEPNEFADLRFGPSSIDCALTDVAQFALVAQFGDGSTIDVTASSQTQYFSSDSAVALIFGNQVLCIQRGQATIQAAYGGLTATATLNVR